LDVYLDVEGDLTGKTFRPARRRVVWWVFGRWLAVFDLVMLVALLVVWSQEGFTTTAALVTEVAGTGLIVLAILLLVAPRSRRNKALSEGHFHLVAREDGYVVEGPFGTQTWRWTMYRKAYIDGNFVYLFLSSRLAQVIPLKMIPDPKPLVDHLTKLGLLRRTPRSFFLV
jgi:YcxB-like protein